MKIKLLIIVFSLLLTVGVVGTFWDSSIAEAASGVWNSCPKGLVNDPYPGACRSYVDSNGDSICDFSQSAPASSSLAPTSTSQSTSITATTAVNTGSTTSDITTGIGTSDTASSDNTRSYHFLLIFCTVVALYCLTWLLSAKKIFTTLTHRKIWNVILLVSCLVCCLLGLILTINLDLGTNITLPFSSLFWHVEAGIALGVVGISHILWHWRYFAKMVGVNPNAKVSKMRPQNITPDKVVCKEYVND